MSVSGSGCQPLIILLCGHKDVPSASSLNLHGYLTGYVTWTKPEGLVSSVTHTHTHTHTHTFIYTGYTHTERERERERERRGRI